MPEAAAAHEVYGREYVPLPTAREAAAADHAAREDWGVPERVLMENAGRGAALVLQRLFPAGRIVGVAGSGNNGGDLLVMLRILHSWGRDVAVVAAGGRAPDAALAHGADIRVIDDDDTGERLLAGADVLVDGMLGTGSEGPLRGHVAAWVERINTSGRPVLALDLPTGVDANTGRVAEGCIRADVTVTFGWPKLGLLLQPARAYCGRIIAIEIGFPEACTADVQAALITPVWALRRLPARPQDAHKGTAGRLLVLAGSEGMAGAAALAADAAQRAGAGLLRIASPAANRVVLQTLVPEATFVALDGLHDDVLEPMHAVVAGPGLGTGDDARAALRRVFDAPPKPTALDADALNLLAQDTGMLEAVAAARPLLITPHARELSRLTGETLEDIVADMPAAARAAARRFGCSVLLKGQPSLVAQPNGMLFINAVGSSDVATAGMGDQLAGVIGALLAAGATPVDAACVALYLCGRGAELAARGRSLAPRDVTEMLPHAIARVAPAASPLDLPFVTFDQPPRW
jgi:ADP-dependent NAD(P)H-hydrate dehydratase / NAD(P)H-hydrate epimerase